MNLTRVLAFSAVFACSFVTYAQTTPPPAKVQDPAQKEAPKKEAPKEEAKNGLKKYEDVITDKAVSQAGMFKVHRIEDKIFFEIPANLMGKDMLWQTEMAGLPANTGYAGLGMGTRVISWSRRNNKIYMSANDYDNRSVGDPATTLAVEKNNVKPILMAFDVQTEGKGTDGKPTAVIDVTSLYTSDPADFSVKSVVGGQGIDGGRSWVDKVKAFPTNIETRSNLTFTTPGKGRSASTALVHYSLVLLPDKPMVGRYKDSRIGFFTQGFTQYGGPENRHIDHEYIDRFRLEKKDPNAAMSEPVKPITFYLSREVPMKWRQCIKDGIEDWKVAFEQAGFKNAIIAKDAPTMEEDPDWDPEDARYSVIRWVPSTTANAMGPSIQDPRSGETISAHVIYWNDVLELAENWYFAQAGAIDPKAHKLPLPDPLIKELMRYVASHEIGHTLGLEHNMKGSAWYTPAQLRDPAFTTANGVSASIMDYSRFNYVAQPGDGVTRTIGGIGPYDKFAIEYGYKVFDGNPSAGAQVPMLDNILSRQVGDPRLRFGNYKFSQDPSTQSEDISSDAVQAGTLGFANIDRIATNYLWSASTKFGEDYSRLVVMRDALVSQRTTETFHVMRLLGGVVETDYHVGRGNDVFAPVPAEKQRRAALFLLDNCLTLPKSLMNPRVMNKIEPDGTIGETTRTASVVLSGMLAGSRVQRMLDNEAANGGGVYTVHKMVGDITNSVFKELSMPHPVVNVYRRDVQRAYLNTMDGKVNGTKNDLRLLSIIELKSLQTRIKTAIPTTADAMTRAHLEQTSSDISKILNNKYATAPGGGGSILDFLLGWTDQEEGCWSGKVIDPDLLLELKAKK